MGWAKYYEDNVSICIGRMTVKESISVKHDPVRCYSVIDHRKETTVQPVLEHMAKSVKMKTIFDEPKRNGRRGIEISFAITPEVKICRKLQMNGWWWSAAKKCWCNLNTKANRMYAEETARRYQAQITIVIS